MPETPQKELAVFTGILDMYVAKRLTPDTADAAPTYDTPRVAGAQIEVTISPVFAEGELVASNRVQKRVRKVTRYNIRTNLASIAPEIRDYVLGREKDANGVEILGTGGNVECAVGLARTKDTGAKELWWLYRGQFSEFEVSGRTEEPGTINFQTPTIEVVCEKRIHDGKLGMVVDSDDAAIPASVIAGWFGEVYEAASQKAE